MKYWYTPEEMGLTKEQIDEKVEELWNEAVENSEQPCPDCGVEPGEVHVNGCDVALCHQCGCQAISCNCGCKEPSKDIWTGIWPGIEECYKRKLITYSNPNRLGGTGWTFCLNDLIRE